MNNIYNIFIIYYLQYIYHIFIIISLNTIYKVLFVQFPPNGSGEKVFSIVFDVNCLPYTTYIEFNDCIVSQTLNCTPSS